MSILIEKSLSKRTIGKENSVLPHNLKFDSAVSTQREPVKCPCFVVNAEQDGSIV